jgi:peptide/nickel transport system substrate-binding protein
MKHNYSGLKTTGLILLAAVLILSIIMLSGCSSASPTPSATSPAVTAPSTTAPAVSTSAPAVTTSAPAVTTAATKPATTPVAATSNKYGGTLRWIQGTGPGVPIGIPWESSGAAAFNQQHSLEFFLKEMVDGSFKPVLATSWDIDTKTPAIIFHLRKGVKFHDGTDFNATAAKWNLEKQMVPSGLYYGSTINWKSVDVVDDYTLKVTLKAWQNIALGNFASFAATFISPTAFDKQGLDGLRWNMVGTGPFAQTKFQRDVALDFTKNTNYWDQGLPYVDKLQVIYSTELLTCAALLKSGGAEILNCQGSAVTANDVQAAGFKIIRQPEGTGGLTCMISDSVNTDSPWSNVKVRQAAEYAIDKEALAKAFGGGFSIPAYQIMASNSSGHDTTLTPRKFDQTKAKQLLTEAGFPNGFKTTIVGAPFGLNKDLVVAVQAYFKTVGIQAELSFPAAAQAQEYINGSLPHNSILVNPMMLTANTNRVMNQYFNVPATVTKFAKRPDGFGDLMNESMATPDLDPVLAKKLEAAMYNDAIVLPIAWGLAPFATATNVNDSGIGTRSSLTYWEPQAVWLSK